MLIKTLPPHPVNENDVTDEAVFLNRRQILRGMGFLGAGALLGQTMGIGNALAATGEITPGLRSLQFTPASAVADALTSEAKATRYNNFYEFGYDKEDPAREAHSLKTQPWTLRVAGEVAKPRDYGHDDLFRFPLEERIYRLRCVEAWSMVIPWIGFPLSALLKQVEPGSKARYVAFQTLHDPAQMPGQRTSLFGGGIEYPYVEGLRIDEAMHPLTLVAVGMYGKTLPPQNGAPLRLVVPWKYGFKSIKSIVGITLTEQQPPTTWNLSAPDEYGFYANVNPAVDHPRWSQASERRITTGGLGRDKRIPTLPFNGYADEVAHLYAGMDLRRNY